MGSLPEAEDGAGISELGRARAGLTVVGAGLPRTGTNSLKVGLERLLGGPCYHMLELFEHFEHVPFWRAALRDSSSVSWSEVLEPYVAAVDYPASAFWRELADAHPSALVVLSLRTDGATWWDSVTATVLNSAMPGTPSVRPIAWKKMIVKLFDRMVPEWRSRDLAAREAAAVRAYDAHVAAVREAFAGTGRLIEWRATDGWEPLCAALGLPVPDEPFPKVNTREDWAARQPRAD